MDSQRIMDITLNEFNTHPTAFICTNIQETDLAGHAEDVARYAERLQVVDRNLARLVEAMQPDDCLVVMADHGNDPTIGHSHHTREVVPVLVYHWNTLKNWQRDSAFLPPCLLINATCRMRCIRRFK